MMALPATAQAFAQARPGHFCERLPTWISFLPANGEIGHQKPLLPAGGDKRPLIPHSERRWALSGTLTSLHSLSKWCAGVMPLQLLWLALHTAGCPGDVSTHPASLPGTQVIRRP